LNFLGYKRNRQLAQKFLAMPLAYIIIANFKPALLGLFLNQIPLELLNNIHFLPN